MKHIFENIQPLTKRIKSFCEAFLGLKKNQAVLEAQRCPQCSQPTCIEGCPLGVDVPGFVRALREKENLKALHRIREQNSLAGICGRICSAPCQKACILNNEKNGEPINIKMLERFAFDHGRSRIRQLFNAESSNRNNHKVAIVGSGPSGLMAASVLVELGYKVKIFEAFYLPGGILRYGIPEFKLPKKVLDEEIAYIESLGVEIETNCLVGKTQTILDLRNRGYEVILLAMGSSAAKTLDIKGSDLKRVYFAQEFLMRLNLTNDSQSIAIQPSGFLGDKIIIIGSNAMAVDCARAAIRFNKKVVVVYPQTEADMDVSNVELKCAREEGVQFEVLVNPVEMLSDEDDSVKAVRCVRMDFADKDGKGSWKVVPVKNSEFLIEADTVILSDKVISNSLIAKDIEGLKINRDSSVWVKKDQYATSVDDIFAVGGVVDASSSFIEVLSQGKKAAEKIDSYIQEKSKNDKADI